MADENKIDDPVDVGSLVEPRLNFVMCPICDSINPYSEVGRSGICQRCAEVDRIRKERQETRDKAREALGKMVRASRPQVINAPHISQVCASVIEEMGGIERFCQDLSEDYQDARERNPGSATVMRFGETILRLVRDSTSQRDSAPDVVNMSDDDIVSEMIAVMQDVSRRKNLESAEDGVLAMLEADALDEEEAKDESEGSDTDPGEGVQSEADGSA